MTREEQLLQAVEPNERFFCHNETCKEMALKALKWADEHPNWQKGNPPKDGWYIIVTKESSPKSFDAYYEDGEWHDDGGFMDKEYYFDIIAWLEHPEFNEQS